MYDLLFNEKMKIGISTFYAMNSKSVLDAVLELNKLGINIEKLKNMYYNKNK